MTNSRDVTVARSRTLKVPGAPFASLTPAAGGGGDGKPFAPLAGLCRRLTLPLPFARGRSVAPPARRAPVASATVALADNAVSNAVPLKPASDVVAGAVARAASQSTIHPIDTLKVRLQTASVSGAVSGGLKSVGSLYRGVAGAACGAGIALGAYFAFYGVACNVLARNTQLSPTAIAFIGGGAAAAGSSVVKVPLAVCIRSVQAGVYPNAFAAGRSIVGAAGVRGLFTGFAPTILEDIPDMAFKFAAYETLRQAHRRCVGGRDPSFVEDFAIGAFSGAFAAAATTPLDVIKTNMMCTAAARPTMRTASAAIMQQGGAAAFFRGVGPRAASNGVNSAVFFCFFEAIRKHLRAQKDAAAAAVEVTAACA